MKNKFVLSLCILILAVMFSASCFAAEKILFAVVGPMTGDSAALGVQQVDAVRLAIKEINESGGVNGKEFEYIVGDDMGNPNQAVMVAQKFSANKDLLFVLGHIQSGCSISALPAWEKVGLPLISAVNSNTKLTQLGHKNYFRIYVNDDIQMEQLARFAVFELGAKNIGVLWENSDYGKACRDVVVKTIPELGAKILGDESYVSATDRDYSPQITKFKGAGVDCAILMSDYTAGALFLKQSANLGFNPLVVASGGCSHPKLLEIAAEAAEGMYVISAFDPSDKRPKPAKFIEDFETFTGGKPGEHGAYAYDIVYMVKQAIEMGGTTREKLIETLHRSDFEFSGITGTAPIRFDEFGDVPGENSLFLVIKDGEFTTYVPTGS